MPIFRLPAEPVFPRPGLAEPTGLLAVGGDLSPERLIAAYAQGIFPWYGPDEPILWWSPDPRFLLFPGQFKVSRSLRQFLKKDRFAVTFDRAFREVVAACGAPAPGRDETWISPEMAAAYGRLHERGLAHSVEVWDADSLVGGLYGVSLGRAFFGESMFTRESNASKVALTALMLTLEAWDFSFVDCQVHTRHLQSLGARMVPRKRFLALLAEALRGETRQGRWPDPEQPPEV